MNIIELREKGKIGDILEYSEKPGIKYFFKGYGITLLSDRGCQINYWEFLTGKWTIIPPESKVLTARDWAIKKYGNTDAIKDMRFETYDVLAGFEAGHGNGRLEMWLAFEEEYKSNYKSNWPSGITFEYAVKKLKPNQSLEDLGE